MPEVKIVDGQVHVRDLVPEKGFKTDLSGIQASLRGFALPQTEPAQAEVAFSTALGEQVKYAGSLTLSPLASEGAIEANRIRLTNYQPYYQDYILYKVEDGVADLLTHYSFTATDQGPDVKLSAFNLSLTSLRLRKPGETEDFLRAKDGADPGRQRGRAQARAQRRSVQHARRLPQHHPRTGRRRSTPRASCRHPRKRPPPAGRERPGWSR